MSTTAVSPVMATPARSEDRRRSPRSIAQDGQCRVRLRPGHDVSVLNVSGNGILIEGMARLRPGKRVELQMETSANYLHALIARCEVSMLSEQGVTYRAGLTFDFDLD